MGNRLVFSHPNIQARATICVWLNLSDFAFQISLKKCLSLRIMCRCDTLSESDCMSNTLRNQILRQQKTSLPVHLSLVGEKISKHRKNYKCETAQLAISKYFV